MTYTALKSKVRIDGTLVFNTAFHIGSGKEGELATDMGILKDIQGWPVLPGSTLKGCFRATAERLACYLNYSACLLDSSLSGVNCVTDLGYFRKCHEDFKALNSENEKLAWLEKNVCDVCRLFGSPMQASRIFFSDGNLRNWDGTLQVRDGVSLDRDTGTARHGLKYDFEVASAGAAFEITIDLENPESRELALVGAVIAEWENGFRLGGFTSRGLGQVRLTGTRVESVDFGVPEELKAYLLNRQMKPNEQLMKDALNQALNV